MQIPGYRIIRKINQGGMSTVYLAIQLSVGREVALKVMSPALNADPVFSERFQREANIVGQLSHPNIVAIYDIGRYKNLNYIAMDYLPGGSVHDKMSNGLSAQEALRIVSEVSNALDHAHEKGYIHRDIKPENVLFREDNTAILSDFGVAKTVSTASKMTNAGTVVGTPHYMSPEQARGKPIDGRSDLYSLGVVLYEMLTGTVPYRADEAVAIAIKHLTAPIPTLPAQHTLFQPILNKLLAKDPDDRYQRGREVVDAIADISNTMSGNSTRYLTETNNPTAVQIFSLFKALLITSYVALATQVKECFDFIFSWRWTPKRGFFRHPKIAVTEIQTNAITGEDDRATVVSTRVQKATHYQALKNNKLRWGLRSITLSVLLALIWSAFSVALERFALPYEEKLPENVVTAAIKTNHWVQSFVSDSGDVVNIEPDANATIEAVAANEPIATPAATTSVPESPAPIQAAAPPPSYSFTVNTEPVSASVRILNIRDKYFPGIQLFPGKYHVKVSNKGFDTEEQWVEVLDKNTTIAVNLRKTPVPGAVFHNTLANGDRGPAMVIVPAGSFIMGNKATSETAPERRVRFQQPFAVSQYEITFADYAKYAKANNKPMPSDNRWGRGSRPVINVSWQQAKDYVDWLKDTTGRKYRLLTESEWEYIARAGSTGDYWWKSSSAAGNANCRRGCESPYNNLFRTKTAPVGSFKSNRFRVFDSAGNVAEWVEDCYKNHYMGAPTNGSAVSDSSCAARSVRGGSVKSGSEQLKSFYRDKLDPTLGYTDVGFRVLVELY